MQTQTPEYITPDEVAAIFLVDPRTVRNWIAAGRLPAVRPGRHWLIDRLDLERFIEASRTVPTPPAAPGPRSGTLPLGNVTKPSDSIPPITPPPPPPAPQLSRAERRRKKLGR